MLKKSITYTDYNDVTRTEDFMFNLSKAEIVEMELGTTGGLAETINRIVQTQNTPELIRIFKDLVLRAYGVKSADGKRFVKSKELADEFAQTEAYSELFMELATNSDSAAEFMNGIVPKNLENKK